MDDLAADVVAVLDALRITRTHYLGLSLGGMSGLGLAIHHASRLLSLCLCSARADAPPSMAAPWDERIATVLEHGGCAPLSQPTIERWFGVSFVNEQPALAERFLRDASTTSVAGFVGCALAIQSLDYLSQAAQIRLPTTLIAGASDAAFPQAMRELQSSIAGSHFDVIPRAGHLPHIDRPAAFNAAMLAHFERCTGAR
jgi:3-oxoadipate enol-lactonase